MLAQWLCTLPRPVLCRPYRANLVGIQGRLFHCSRHRSAPPLAWFFFKPVAKVTSALFGRILRKRWQNLSAEEKFFYKNKYSNFPGQLFTAACVFLVANYIYHTETTPETKRKRYIAFTHEQFMKIVEIEYQQVLKDSKEVASTEHGKNYQRISRIVKRIVESNSDIEFFRDTTWKVTILKDDITNAFVLPNGHIFVYTGLFDIATNDDQLAVILGHEMAHAYLNHGAEKVSLGQFLDIIVIFGLAAIWAIMPTDGIAVITQWFMHKVMDLLFSLPYSRKLEIEADQVGLKLIAKACYDVRESSNFWMLMKVQELMLKQEANKNQSDAVVAESIPEWLSTHPNNDNRIHLLNELIPEAAKLRQDYCCPRMNAADPRRQGEMLLEILHQHVDTLKAARAAEVQPIVLRTRSK